METAAEEYNAKERDMATFNQIEVFQKIEATGMVPVFYHPDAEVAFAVVKACYDGGVRAFEFTNRGDFAQDVFVQVSKRARRECPDLALGVGTVIDAPTAALYLQMGADFVVSPLLNAEVARVCHRRCVPYVPGCATVSEVSQAQELGCYLIKCFPGSVLTPKFVSDLRAPLPWSRLMVTGGVAPTEESLSAWFKAGVTSVGMGSKLFPHDRVAAGDWQYITDKCQEALTIIRKVRKA